MSVEIRVMAHTVPLLANTIYNMSVGNVHGTHTSVDAILPCYKPTFRQRNVREYLQKNSVGKVHVYLWKKELCWEKRENGPKWQYIFIHSDFQFESNIFFFVLEVEKERNASRTSDFIHQTSMSYHNRHTKRPIQSLNWSSFRHDSPRFPYWTETLKWHSTIFNVGQGWANQRRHLPFLQDFPFDVMMFRIHFSINLKCSSN